MTEDSSHACWTLQGMAASAVRQNKTQKPWAGNSETMRAIASGDGLFEETLPAGG